MKKFVYWCNVVGAIAAFVTMVISIICVAGRASYHPLWALSALGFFGCAVSQVVIANIYRTGFTGWQQEKSWVWVDSEDENNGKVS